jgi:hypothetical protein
MIRILAFLAMIMPAAAHSWYEPWCCSERDCAPISNTEIEWTPEGWHVIGENLFFQQGDHSLRQSQDNGWHRCVVPSTGATRCLYAPDPGL